jgi:PPOX class probable F420-dependent enzyme
VTPHQARRRFAAARVARLATADAVGRPHIVPVTFAVDGDIVYSAVDAKPKRSTSLKRLVNVAANPAVALLVDHYADDWNELWWVRADGTGRVVEPEDPEGVRALSARRPLPALRRARGRARRRRTPLVRLGRLGRDRGRLRWRCCVGGSTAMAYGTSRPTLVGFTGRPCEQKEIE